MPPPLSRATGIKTEAWVCSPADSTHASSFKSGDRDKDGQLTRAEHRAIFERQFVNAHDKNGDGFITTDEM